MPAPGALGAGDGPDSASARLSDHSVLPRGLDPPGRKTSWRRDGGNTDSRWQSLGWHGGRAAPVRWGRLSPLDPARGWAIPERVYTGPGARAGWQPLDRNARRAVSLEGR